MKGCWKVPTRMIGVYKAQRTPQSSSIPADNPREEQQFLMLEDLVFAHIQSYLC